MKTPEQPVNKSIPYLSGEALAELNLGTAEVIECIEAHISANASGTVWCAPKSVILPDDGRYMMATLAAAQHPPLLAVKTVVLNPRNPGHGLPQINGLVTVLNSQTGLPIAILDANWITAVRTAGLSATAAKYMARKDASVAAFIGCGVQAVSHLKAFADLFPLEQIRVLGKGQSNIDNICLLAESMSLKPTICTNGNDVVAGADLIVSSITYSASLEPFIDANSLKPGSFTSITDLGTPWIKSSYGAFDIAVVDDLEQEAAMPTKLIPPGYVSGDLSGLVLGKLSGRRKESERTAFIFRGHAIGDLALSVLAIEKLVEAGKLEPPAVPQ